MNSGNVGGCESIVWCFDVHLNGKSLKVGVMVATCASSYGFTFANEPICHGEILFGSYTVEYEIDVFCK